MKYFMGSKQRGFSLVELSVVLTIIGITLAGALDLATRKTEADRVTETNTRLDAIETALKVYVINNQRLPCPAASAAALNTSTAGTSTMSGAGCTSNTYTYTYTTGGNTTLFYTGAVPVKELKIPDKMIADDWDRRFTYVVDKRFVNNASTATCVSYTTTPGSQMCFKNTTITSSSSAVVDNTSIQVQDLSSNSSSVRATDAVYAIISHGKNGYGAWTYGGTVAATQLTASSNADEILNAPTANTSGSSAPYPAFVQGDTNTVYDDIVRYKTKAQIIAAVLGITEADTCTASWDNANATAANPCTGASSVANCNALAVQVGKFCLQP